jgi:cytochrome c oxidase assembly factor CtaG
MMRLALLLCCLAAPAHAHGDAHAVEGTMDFQLLVPLFLVAFVYAKGTLALRRARFGSRRSGAQRAAAFVTGLLAIALALAGPMHAWAERSFAAHMIEHELLIVVAAPLLVLARPGGVLLWAFGRRKRQAIAIGLRQSRILDVWRTCRGLQAATILHGAALWMWHLPPLFDAALRIEALHWLQHATFLLTGVWFWQAIFSAAGRERMALAVADLFATTMHLGLLGGLIALARHPLYASLSGGGDPLQDQQLAGVIMWAPGCLVYALVALLIAARMLRPSAGKTGATA